MIPTYPTYQWSEVRKRFKGSKRGLQMVETLERLGMPEPTGDGRTGDWCAVRWDVGGHHFHVHSDMDCWGFNDQ